MTGPPARRMRAGWIGPALVGLATSLALVPGGALWASRTEIAGAVVASGTLGLREAERPLQVAEGGVVAEISVQEGDTVAAGTLLLRLDSSALASQLAIVEAQLFEIAVRAARISAEITDADAPDFSALPEFDTVAPDWAAAQVSGQLRLFEVRRKSRQLGARDAEEGRRQLVNRIDGLKAERDATARRLALLRNRAEDQSSLRARGLVRSGELAGTEQAILQAEGSLARLSADIAEARGQIAQSGIDEQRRAETEREAAVSRLRDLRYGEIELARRRIELRERIARLSLRAPVAGTVFDLRAAAPGAVVAAGERVMSLIPGRQTYLATLHVDPAAATALWPGQPARIRTAAAARDDPDIPGKVARIAPAPQTEPRSGRSFVEVTVELAPPADITAAVMANGMPVEGLIATSQRTALSYLTAPLTRYFRRALRDG